MSRQLPLEKVDSKDQKCGQKTLGKPLFEEIFYRDSNQILDFFKGQNIYLTIFNI